MATPEVRFEQAAQKLEDLKKKVSSQFKYHSEQIEMILGRAQRTVQRGDMDKVSGYGNEIKQHADKIDDIFEDIADVIKQHKNAEGDRDGDQDIFEDSVASFEDSLKDFQKEHRLASDDPMRIIVRRTMEKLKSS